MSILFNSKNIDPSFFECKCALCRQPLNPDDVFSFLAVTSCHPDPGRAEWRDFEGLQLLCLENTAASKTWKNFGEPPGMFLVHPCCNEVISTAKRHRSLFDCFRALGPVLHEEDSTIQRTWKWSSSCVVYAPILRSILSDAVIDADDKDAALLRARLKQRLALVKVVKDWVPAEISDMVLDYLPFELALALDYFSGGQHCLRRLRQDPIGRRFELAHAILGHELWNHDKEIKLESEMILRFVWLGNRGYLQDLHSKAGQEKRSHGQVGKIEQFTFSHNHHRKPYIAVQVDDIGITHIAFDLVKPRRPRWISPNAADSKAAFFQDSGSADHFDYVVVASDGLKLCTVDIPEQSGKSLTRAILRPDVSASHWSLSPYDLLYVRPSMIDITNSSGVYVQTPPGPGMPGFRMSNSPQPGFRELKFDSEGVPRTVELISTQQSSVVFVRFHGDKPAEHSDTIVEPVDNVVGIWQFQFACNLVVADKDWIGHEAVG